MSYTRKNISKKRNTESLSRYLGTCAIRTPSQAQSITDLPHALKIETRSIALAFSIEYRVQETSNMSAARRLLVDVHTHVYLPRYAQLLRSRNVVPRIVPRERPDAPGTTEERLVIFEDEPISGRPVGPQVRYSAVLRMRCVLANALMMSA